MRMTKTAWRRIAGGLLLAALAVWLVVINVTGMQGDAPQTVNGSRCRNITYFQDFSMETFDGGVFTAADVQQAKLVVFNAWGPYCANCLTEMPYLDEIWQEYRDRGLVIAGIQSDAHAYPEDMPLARQEAIDTGVTYPLLIADAAYDAELRPMLMDALPGTWIVDSEGRILDFCQGGKMKAAWIDYITPYLGGEDL